MQSLPLRPILDLMAAACARRGYNLLVGSLPYSGEQNLLAYSHTQLVVLLFVAKGARHAAAAGRDDFHRVIGG